MPPLPESFQLRILLSYWGYRESDLDGIFAKNFRAPYPEAFADSGAFSADAKGETIRVEDYIAWLGKWSHLFCTCANLDVIGNPEATWENQQRIEAAGFPVLPVFHTGEPWKWLDHYLERYTYIALGGMVPYARYPKVLMPWLIRCFQRAEGRAVFHGFGATSWAVISNLPWYSVDSSTWGTGFRFGQVPLFDPRAGKFYDLKLGEGKEWERREALVREMGFNPADFAVRARYSRAKVCALSALSYMRAEQWLRQRHGEIRIPGGDAAAVLRLHLVETAKAFRHSRLAREGLRMYLVEGANTFHDVSKVARHLESARH